ncbi:protein-L-isoaspartate O-methyltransferase [Allofranklinella schreckenbergeri]|uniref:Protein-L-isoaspartate O-methyltransferase n=1 Tax=Allofranklinella schreckenbergeri TaxID=1076744 RepID=A0A3M6Q606_9BURK|nr:protein-L-isoaspartate O-methyltransferase [Allofranklinella schreckenbergeri]RMW98623.1 protein-L-isoaspartate O-methyltransferase [Allofranklinella schreckenbergeri]RMW98722.1 protein-L-isoaspartate O-methyltransferase [Allofranklinella schreckenbergeri]RRD43053.1 methyltransferase domain-containing protein [Comamonadaceae bacterium OH3737_COT-264]
MTLPLNRLHEFVSAEDVARFNMIEQQIRPWNVENTRVFEALAAVKRENFVPQAWRARAFMDISIPLVPEDQVVSRPDACMLPPKIEARILATLDVQPDDFILEIGAGSGYMAALLAELGRGVVSMESAADMVQLATANLEKNRVKNVEVRHCNGNQGIFDGRFDVIVLSGSVAAVPDAFKEALKEGGRLMACVGHEPSMQMQLIRKANGRLHASSPWDYNLPRLQGFEEPSLFEF